MKVLFVGLARAIWLFDLAALNPEGKNLQSAIEGITKKYQFAKAPQNMLDLTERKVLNFTTGSFRNSKGVQVLVTLNIYSDGFVVDTMSSTDDSTAFIIELFDWLNKEFDFQIPHNIRKGFLSQIDFECDTPLSRLNPRLDRFSKDIESLAKPADQKVRRFDVGALNFWTEDAHTPGAPSIVKFERKISASFSDNHYFSQASVETETHKKLLNDFEQLLKSS